MSVPRPRPACIHGLGARPPRARREVLGQAAGLEHRPTGPGRTGLASVEGDDGHDWPPVGAGPPVGQRPGHRPGQFRWAPPRCCPAASRPRSGCPRPARTAAAGRGRQRSKAKRQRGWKVHPALRVAQIAIRWSQRRAHNKTVTYCSSTSKNRATPSARPTASNPGVAFVSTQHRVLKCFTFDNPTVDGAISSFDKGDSNQ